MKVKGEDTTFARTGFLVAQADELGLPIVVCESIPPGEVRIVTRRDPAQTVVIRNLEEP